MKHERKGDEDRSANHSDADRTRSQPPRTPAGSYSQKKQRTGEYKTTKPALHTRDGRHLEPERERCCKSAHQQRSAGNWPGRGSNHRGNGTISILPVAYVPGHTTTLCRTPCHCQMTAAARRF